MPDLILTTFDWVPEPPRGYVRDLRVRWALEEAGLPYTVQSTPFKNRGAEHFAHQPFGQVPWLTDGGISIFESGAILLYIGGFSEKLLPLDPRGRSDIIQWIFAALNSVEMASLPLSFYRFTHDTAETPEKKLMDAFLRARLQHMETVLAGREWLAGAFSIADILMADVLRLADRFGGLADFPACHAYAARRFKKPMRIRWRISPLRMRRLIRHEPAEICFNKLCHP
ncbi:glutathione S-transferase family protein [Acinetobacter sp.]|uniref:glutathione S-transferase family protein n=1 Tax=Acinetobacter sp. TaxID=472 RepID=UPI002FCB807C